MKTAILLYMLWQCMQMFKTHWPGFSSEDQWIWHSDIKVNVCGEVHAIIADGASGEDIQASTVVALPVYPPRPQAECEGVVAVVNTPRVFLDPTTAQPIVFGVVYLCIAYDLDLHDVVCPCSMLLLLLLHK